MVEKGNITIKTDKDDKMTITVNLLDFVDFCVVIQNYITFIEKVFVEMDKSVVNIRIVFDCVGSRLLAQIIFKE